MRLAGTLGARRQRDDRARLARADRDPLRGGGRAARRSTRTGASPSRVSPASRARRSGCSCERRTATTTFHDVVVAPELRTIPTPRPARSAPTASCAGPGWTVALFDGPGEGDEATGTPAPERFAALIAQLLWHAGKDEERDPNGDSETEVTVRAGTDVPWRMAQWLLQCASHPSVRIRRFRLRVVDAGGGIEQSILLPRDEGLGSRGIAGTPPGDREAPAEAGWRTAPHPRPVRGSTSRDSLPPGTRWRSTSLAYGAASRTVLLHAAGRDASAWPRHVRRGSPAPRRLPGGGLRGRAARGRAAALEAPRPHRRA